MPESSAQQTGPVEIPERLLFEGRPAVLDSVGRWIFAVLTLGLAGFFWWLGAVTLRIRITDQRLVLKRGLLTVRTDFLELYRVTDLVVEEPFGERLLGYGRLVLTSSDRSDPQIVLRGLRSPDALANQLRPCIEAQKQLRRVTTFSQA